MEGQILTFALGEEQYGVDILRVKEIRGYAPVTPLPGAPAYVRGVLNLRGTIVPVLDLRAKLAMPEAEYGPLTVIIIVTAGASVVGVIVDAVSDVFDVRPEDVQPAPEFGVAVQGRAVAGIARVGDQLVVLLELDQMLGDTAALNLPAVAADRQERP